MDAAGDLLKNTIPEVGAEKLDFLSSQLVTRKEHDHRLDEQYNTSHKQIQELREMLSSSDQCAKALMDRIEMQQKTITKLQLALQQSLPSIPETQERSHTERMGSNNPPQVNSSHGDNTNINKAVEQQETDVKKLHDDIKKKESGLKSLQQKYNKSQKDIQLYKKKLGLPGNASMDQVEKRIQEMTKDNQELCKVKTCLRREMETSAELRRQLREETRKIEHVRIKLNHKELELRQLKQIRVSTPRLELSMASISLPQTPSSYPKQCLRCDTPLQPVHFCDLCNISRIKMK